MKDWPLPKWWGGGSAGSQLHLFVPGGSAECLLDMVRSCNRGWRNNALKLTGILTRISSSIKYLLRLLAVVKQP